MPTLNIILEADGSFPDLKERQLKRLHPTNILEAETPMEVTKLTVTCLDAGMTSGAPSVAFIVELDKTSLVFAETSLALFLTAAETFKARYGDPRTPERWPRSDR